MTGAINPKKGWPLYNPYDYKNFKFIKSDCVEWFKKNKLKKFDYVLHLAAIVGGREMIENNPLAVAQDLTIDSKFWGGQFLQNQRKSYILVQAQAIH